MGSSEFASEGINVLAGFVTELLGSFSGFIGQAAEIVSTWVSTF